MEEIEEKPLHELIVKSEQLHPRLGTVYVISLNDNYFLPLRSQLLGLLGTEVLYKDEPYVITNFEARGQENVADIVNLLLRPL